MDSLGLAELVGVRHGGLVLGGVTALVGAGVGGWRAVGLEELVIDQTLHASVGVRLQHVRGRYCEHALVLAVLHIVLLSVEPLALVSTAVAHLVLTVAAPVLTEPAVTLMLPTVGALVISVLREPVLLSKPVLVPESVGICVGCEPTV